ncbi:FAD-dependent oxidoreductase [Arabiibacter massiliensis]|uniref:FAD-dependent oxidoreductase n=1 Tax=Arabiibacter massiliensis TaxID=1870985 RepID=UPI00155A88E6|nr:FAD-dependent oxidoreductase [Arabiibacter massiliensis]
MGAVSMAGLGALAGCAPQGGGSGGTAAGDGPTFADTIAWDGEYDVVVLGFGAAGAASARYAAKEGAKVLLVDKAPLGNEGGNTRYCGQFIQYSDDKEAMKKYFNGLAAGHDFPEDVAETYCQGLTETKRMLIDDFDIPEENFLSWKTDECKLLPLIANFIPEYPEIEGGDKLDLLTVSREEQGYAHLWNAYRTKVMSLSDQIDVWFTAPATHLFQDPVSKAVIGVEIEHEGKTVNIRALNGVVLALGGFENNAAMAESYLGLTKFSVSGTLFNTGDGIKLGAEVGADFWHMEAYEGNCFTWGGVSFPTQPNEHNLRAGINNPYLGIGSIILVGEEGQRYLTESATARHGHMPFNGEWVMVKRPATTYVVFDQAQLEYIDSMKGIPDNKRDTLVKADTIAELEKSLGMPEGRLQQTVAGYNAAAKSGVDPDFNRTAESMRPFADAGPYYAFEIVQAILNTQGGPRRNGNAEVLGTDGEPIPHFYSAGECGGITSFQYNGGGNMAECLIFGRAAGINAAAPKDPLPPLPTNVASDIQFTQGSGSGQRDTDPSTVSAGTNEYIGSSTSGMGGQMILKVTKEGGKITKIDFVEQHETAGIGGPALEALPQAIIDANSPDVDVVTGATMSSRGIIDAVKDALSKA